MKTIELRKEYQKLVGETLPQIEYSRRVANATLKEIGSLPLSARTFQTVGKAFFVKQIPEIQSSLVKKIEASEKDLSSIENRKSNLEKDLLNSEKQVQKLYEQIQQQQ